MRCSTQQLVSGELVIERDALYNLRVRWSTHTSPRPYLLYSFRSAYYRKLRPASSMSTYMSTTTTVQTTIAILNDEHAYQHSTKKESRCPCPALNAMSNHGYLCVQSSLSVYITVLNISDSLDLEMDETSACFRWFMPSEKCTTSPFHSPSSSRSSALSYAPLGGHSNGQ